ncbi:MAG: hypothetical protein US83_C0010G0047 [Candidatus Falkowbacteria bacterium GW2011_GWC2_38_22]|uniref:Uncharacterized protein n=1 Tax=Candidatus Falkowbacteria bacterium GW2011_GWE1_38_31 TaxID=1618638 RepID=A0A0G0JU83_9BACT|nr:MAG: hypothetical protein US73_C0005G0047 [Candidatus Falkowbacteria bacterium GW2011_GWF2_38_1205]KKQ61013.1 MAG: hypothetical protein US83_C0010G0047 [Candidatus Falkowbacteria bacterium GW2011_GWC2_38_22]KKQ63458.1 MAG: hypothetical protein US84_C0006G0061 [Candidatus Falkowbacteria bacterium GW2011_GWF1_38_22]KKQ65471.1 MAG: hypothetical protein US87_C0007G0047 [Candidatus Falkowbacteria bacterium GW2011_GWE2_38_254]KKQ70222.1 MAG: hypothetical protein US91_C0006G0061 [Candidatus Falkowb
MMWIKTVEMWIKIIENNTLSPRLPGLIVDNYY